MEDRVNSIRRELLDHLDQDNDQGLKSLFKVTHPSDFGAVLEVLELPEARKLFFRLPNERKPEVLCEVTPGRAVELLKDLPEDLVVQIMVEMPPDDAADIFLTFNQEEQDQLLSRIDDDNFRRTLTDLITYPPDSAGGIMTTEYIAVNEEKTVDEAIKVARRQAEDAEMFNYLYAQDGNNRLSGVLAMRDLFLADSEDKIRDVSIRDVVSVSIDDDQEEVAKKLDRYNLLALPVVDHQDHMRGIITVDDAVGILEQEATEDMYKQAGISPYQELEAKRSIRLTRSSFLKNLNLRAPWLSIVFLGTLLTASSVSLFEGYLEQIVELAFFMPVIAAMGGNVGAQSTTIFVRGLTLGQVDTRNFWKPLLSEVYKTGLGIGLFFGGSLGLTAWAWQSYLREAAPMGYALDFGLAVGLSLFLSIVAASANGFLIPWIVSVMGADPATASNPLLTTVQDILGIFIYFGCAGFFLKIF